MNKFVKSILDPIGVPVVNTTYLGGENTYIVFNVWSVPSLHANDEEILSTYTVQIDIFSPGSTTNLENEVKNRMKKARFMRSMEMPGEYIQEAKLYRKMMRFKYSREVE